MSIGIRTEPFDPYGELHRFEGRLRTSRGSVGAVASFIGVMRDVNQGDAIAAMTLEHYPGMTEKQLGRIVDEARRRWDLIEALVIHRVGELHPGDPIVLVAVWSAHRAAAFEACRYLIEELKTRAPFWKKEHRARVSARWVEHNTVT